MNAARLRELAWQAAVLGLVCAAVVLAGLQAAANLKARGIARGFDYFGRAAASRSRPARWHTRRATPTRGRWWSGSSTRCGCRRSAMSVATVLGVGVGIGAPVAPAALAGRGRGDRGAPQHAAAAPAASVAFALVAAAGAARGACSSGPASRCASRGLYLPAPWGSPVVSRFGVQGGLWISPEFATLLVGLSICTAAYIGEIVRGGVLAVDQGQTDAAAALGLSRGRRCGTCCCRRRVRMMVPPMTSQFVNVVKNSSLGVAIGYPDLISLPARP